MSGPDHFKMTSDSRTNPPSLFPCQILPSRKSNMNRTLPFPWWASLVPVALLGLITARSIQDYQAQRLVSQAIEQSKAFAFDDGLATLRRSAELESRDARTQLELGKAARTLWVFRDKPELKAEADRAFEAAKRNSPSWPIPHYEHARMYSAKGLYAEALKLLEPAIRIDPNNAGYHLEAGRYLEALNRREEARVAYAECWAIDTVVECEQAIKRLGGTP